MSRDYDIDEDEPQVKPYIQPVVLNNQTVFIVRGSSPNASTVRQLKQAGFLFDDDAFPGTWSCMAPELWALGRDLWPNLLQSMILNVKLRKERSVGFSFQASPNFDYQYDKNTGVGVLLAKTQQRTFWDAVSAMWKASDMIERMLVFSPTVEPSFFTDIGAAYSEPGKHVSFLFEYITADGFELMCKDQRGVEYDEDDWDDDDGWAGDDDQNFTTNGRRVRKARKSL